MSTLPNDLQNMQKHALSVVNDWKSDGLKIVFTNGCFDLLHPGHLYYLEQAASLGDKLVVGLNTDDSVRKLKGEQRPINKLTFRQTMLEGLKSVNLVIPFSEDTPYLLIELISPYILVKGGDYLKQEIVGADLVEKKGGTVKVIPFLKGYSSSELINKIRSSYG